MLESKFDATDVVAAGHPPVAEGVVLVDFDGVLSPFGRMFDAKPYKGVKKAIKLLKKNGLRVVIFTSRLSPTWHKHEGWSTRKATKEQREYLEKFLEFNGIPFDDITCEKIPSILYLDDKAMNVESRDYGLYDVVKEWIDGR